MSLVAERLTDTEAESEMVLLFRQIEHGDDGHRDWLWRELRAFFDLTQAPRPPKESPP